jgi:hypothetical protein
LGAAANVGEGAGSTVIVRDAVIVLPHGSVYVQLSVYVPPHELCEPVIVPVTVPAISHAPVALFVYAKTVPVGGAALQGIVRLGAAANAGVGAGSTVIVREAVIVLPHGSV